MILCKCAPSFRHLLPFLLLLSAASRCHSARLSPAERGDAVPVDVLEGQWMQFDCPYDQSLDKSKLHELAANVQGCEQPALELQQDSERFSRAVVAAVLGKVSVLSDSIKTDVLRGRDPPVLQVNSGHPLVQAGLVEVVEADSSLSLIRLRVRADGNRTGGLCAVCGQTASFFKYSAVKKRSLRIRKPPAASLSFVSKQISPASQFSETRDADGVRKVELLSTALPGPLLCEGGGEQLISVRLLKDGQLLNETADARLEHSLGSSFKEELIGNYQCEAVSGLLFLMEKGKNVGSDAIYLLGPFKPRFELSELVRYTPVGQQEDIQVKVLAYPQSSPVICSFEYAGHPVPVPELQQPYNQKDFSSTYLIRLSNSLPGNETKLTCSSNNDLGRAKLSIRLTALAPQPEIVSDGSTRFYNSYQLRWQHDARAYVDFYRVQILFKTGDNNSTARHEEFSATISPAPNGATAALVGTLSGGGGGGGVVSGRGAEKRQNSRTLYNLRPDTEHEIRLSSCNQHGCSEFSDPVEVRTQKESDQTYNDPANPVKAFLNPRDSANAPGVSPALLSMAVLAAALGLLC